MMLYIVGNDHDDDDDDEFFADALTIIANSLAPLEVGNFFSVGALQSSAGGAANVRAGCTCARAPSLVIY